MALYESFIKPLAFRFDPEFIHERALSLLARGLIRAPTIADPRLEQTLFGARFPNPLGLAAGFDKNGVALNHWHQLGFGFVEVGTVTLHAQPGNPRPRMFRYPEEHALINRLGFNNHGAARLAQRLASSNAQIPVGINLGKSKITPLEQAAADYRGSFEMLHHQGDYFVVNVSSPNTPGLRSLQDKGPLVDIIGALKDVDANRPLFVKVAPDLEWPALEEIIQVSIDSKLTGLIATNTTLSRERLKSKVNEQGGLSGVPLKERANLVLAHLYRHCPRDMILIGVGGIMSGDDLYEKVALGAHLCQVYTGWIYGGPSFAPAALQRLLTLMDRDAVPDVTSLRGTGVKDP